MSHKYNVGLIRSKASYSIGEIAQLYSIDRRTCGRWLREGLKPIDIEKKPLLIMGKELKKFFKEKQQSQKSKLNEDEYFCFKCRKPRTAYEGSERIVETGKTVGKNKVNQQMKKAKCRVCKSKMNRLIKVCQKRL
ncbi:MAG: hypothetical protein HOE53_01855 [Candidatus Magasanikbacteria bacterium]|nr:hypothetical protein [Candidatus Magasanikbacteria bacterium]